MFKRPGMEIPQPDVTPAAPAPPPSKGTHCIYYRAYAEEAAFENARLYGEALDCLQEMTAERDAMAEVVKAAREYAEQNELRRDIGRQGRASLGDTTERPVPPDYSRLLAALTALDTPETSEIGSEG